jgi:hypothetical protein
MKMRATLGNTLFEIEIPSTTDARHWKIVHQLEQLKSEYLRRIEEDRKSPTNNFLVKLGRFQERHKFMYSSLALITGRQ